MMWRVIAMWHAATVQGGALIHRHDVARHRHVVHGHCAGRAGAR
jgi:hypothetical protein